MEKKNVQYVIENKVFDFQYDGETLVGEDKVLMEDDVNLLKNTAWDDEGYTIQDFLTDENVKKVKNGFTELIKTFIIEGGGKIDDKFCLEKYHTYVDDVLHLKIAKDIKGGFSNQEFPINFEIINTRMSEILGQEVSTKAEVEDENLSGFYLRIVRPNSLKDNNPPHRDVWLDRLRNAINIYYPICGSTSDSALPILPSSHYIKESYIERTANGAILNDAKYTVPCVVSVNNESVKMIRPNPGKNQVLVFSPYLVHGGGYNLNLDETRISLEVRFWKKNNN
jgi:hypothetical protein